MPQGGKCIRQNSRGTVEYFIRLPPPFSLPRCIDEDNRFFKNAYYRDNCPMIKQFVFKASSEDGAFRLVLWNDTVGDHHSMLKYCKNQHPVSISCIDTDAQGSVNTYNPAYKISYTD